MVLLGAEEVAHRPGLTRPLFHFCTAVHVIVQWPAGPHAPLFASEVVSGASTSAVRVPVTLSDSPVKVVPVELSVAGSRLWRHEAVRWFTGTKWLSSGITTSWFH